MAVAVVVLAPALVGLLGVGPPKLRWGMYSDASHLNVRYEVVSAAGDPREADLDALEPSVRADHVGTEALISICEHDHTAVVVRRIVGGEVREEVRC